jgi:hypothetical protein
MVRVRCHGRIPVLGTEPARSDLSPLLGKVVEKPVSDTSAYMIITGAAPAVHSGAPDEANPVEEGDQALGTDRLGAG